MNADSALRWPPTLRPSQPTWKKATVYIHHCHLITTQPKSWYSFYRPTEGGRLSRPRHCSKGVHPVPKAEDITVVTPKNSKNHRCMHMQQSRKKRHDKTHKRSAFRQSLMASVGESQVVNKTPVWYLSIMESRLLRAVIVRWYAVITVAARHMLHLKHVLHLSAGQCPTHMAREPWGSQLSYR